MAGRLEGKTALVMGAGSIGPGWGTGKATAVAYAREGASVACADVNESAARETHDLIAAEGGQAIVIRCDATKSDQVAAAVARCMAWRSRLDVLHNNIGVAAMGSVVDLPEEDWDRNFDTNLKTAFLAMKHAIPVMLRSGGGAIVNIVTGASGGCAAERAFAQGIALMSKAVAVEYGAAPSVRVNCAQTRLVGLESAGEPLVRDSGVVPLAVYLASGESPYATGVVLEASV